MRRILVYIGLAVCLLACAPTLYQRWLDERSHHQVAILVDWKEVRDLANRQIPSPVYLLQSLHNAGVQGILFSPLTLKETVHGADAALGNRSISFDRSTQGEQAFDQLKRRGVTGLETDTSGDHFSINRALGDFSSLGDVEIGYDQNLLELSRDQGLPIFLRVNQDPWMQTRDPLPDDIAGLIFTSDDPPGGSDATADWATELRTKGLRHLLVEFKPTRAALAVAHAFPGATLRTHTIPTPELKDLTPAQEIARWQRAVRERACRCLLFRPAPNESWASFQTRLDLLRRSLLHEGWVLELPAIQSDLQSTRSLKLLIQLGLAFLIATLTPLLGLALALSRRGWSAFLTVACVSMIGGLLVAAAAYAPETRFEIVPFRGIKAVILLTWFGSGFLLYSLQELRQLLFQALTRLDVLIGILLLGVLAYGIVRSGNASASLRPGSEQGVRDYLEKTLEVRPRFKEFAVGYPLLFLGFMLRRRKEKRKAAFDSRPLIGLGMIGPISTVNTFCHLHSPLLLAIVRGSLGIFIGMVIGMTLYFGTSFFQEDAL